MSTAPAGAPTEVIDPVCGKTIAPEEAVGHGEHQGQTYYFCSQSCIDRFRKNPSAFLSGTRPEAAAPVGVDYVCPMDPEVRQKAPGACPKCGMALEPDLASAPMLRTEYACPMHSEIVRDAPGACPICGMALEPRTVGLEEAPNAELIDMTRRFRTAGILSAPVFVLAMADMVLGAGLGGGLISA